MKNANVIVNLAKGVKMDYHAMNEAIANYQFRLRDFFITLYEDEAYDEFLENISDLGIYYEGFEKIEEIIDDGYLLVDVCVKRDRIVFGFVDEYDNERYLDIDDIDEKFVLKVVDKIAKEIKEQRD